MSSLFFDYLTTEDSLLIKCPAASKRSWEKVGKLRARDEEKGLERRSVAVTVVRTSHQTSLK
jgi:hypothetical protein